MKSIVEQMAILMRGVEFGDEHIKQVMERELRERLQEAQNEGRPLRVYCGFDPTASQLTLGHTVPMRKLRQFQDLGHQVIFLIGSFTALIGDPSDKDSARPQQTPEEVAEKSKDYAEQAFKILDRNKTEVRSNADWLGPLTFADLIRLASHFTVQQFLARENFAKRHAKGDPIWLHEFFYALMQAYDAVMLDTDVQIGGTEQLFNLMAGRKLQESLGHRPQVCLTLPILVGTDGHQRMGQSLGNYIGVDEPPEEMYGKVMSIPDHAMRNYFDLLSNFEPAQIADIERRVATGGLHPMEAKMMLARDLVTIYHHAQAAAHAEAHFKRVFQERELPKEMPTHKLAGPQNIVDLLVEVGLAPSKSQARRLIAQGGVRLDGNLVESIEETVTPAKETILQVGKRRFVRLV
ncbi:MAG: tyrosine--tRNA ligase [Chloroflexi bacterium]|nr:tyrosine--tRNA ligase [Chloroflexota bacterium]